MVRADRGQRRKRHPQLVEKIKFLNNIDMLSALLIHKVMWKIDWNIFYLTGPVDKF